MPAHLEYILLAFISVVVWWGILTSVHVDLVSRSVCQSSFGGTHTPGDQGDSILDPEIQVSFVMISKAKFGPSGQGHSRLAFTPPSLCHSRAAPV